jgi:hypothetical protein
MTSVTGSVVSRQVLLRRRVRGWWLLTMPPNCNSCQPSACTPCLASACNLSECHGVARTRTEPAVLYLLPTCRRQRITSSCHSPHNACQQDLQCCYTCTATFFTYVAPDCAHTTVLLSQLYTPAQQATPCCPPMPAQHPSTAESGNSRLDATGLMHSFRDCHANSDNHAVLHH